MKNLNFEKLEGLLPAIIQDYKSRKVLMLGFMNREALEITLKENRVTFFSRTRKELWQKGRNSGKFLEIKEIKVDCDRDTLLIMVKISGPVCHTGNFSCFGD